ncbi:Autotransporter-associated beta strand repeat protein [Salinisphaera sp. C84B14]|uniref:hypothetical protein n=1 Tax=Salinisphaera sp. C84B14 TaxID=1304155 RepID=UPI0033404886
MLEPAGDHSHTGGTVAINSADPVAIAGRLTVNRDGLTFAMNAKARRLIATDAVYIEGGTLTLDLDSTNTPAAGTRLTLPSGENLAGRFARVDSGNTAVELSYSADSVIATIQ